MIPQNKCRLIRFAIILSLTILAACSDEEELKVKFSGTVTTLQINGDVGPLQGVPVEIKLFNNPTSFPGEQPVRITVTTDKKGHYELLVPRGKYTSYDVRVTDDYYRVCLGTLEPVQLWMLRAIDAETNKKDFSVCLTSRYKIALHNNTGSENSVTVATGGRNGNITILSGPGTPVTEDTYINILPNVNSVTFSFAIKNVAGEVVHTFTSTYVPVPGSTEVIDIEY